MTIIVPIKTVSESNAHTHWRVRQQRAKVQRKTIYLELLVTGISQTRKPPLRIILTRLSPRMLDDDNLQGALKHVRDGVADYFGVDDGSDLYVWRYGQRKQKTQGVEVEITSP